MKDHDELIRLLREERPQASELELDQIKQRVMKRAAHIPRKGQPMRSRLAILLMLVLGMLLSGTGAGLAVNSLQGQDDASFQQYGDEEGEEEESDDGGILGEEESGDDAQPAAQVESGDSLPFTGFAAIPVLLGGLALLAAGLVLRRRSADE